ncbi:MAG: T9SS type A sorting domain-containing protein, partial [Bacteroidales bacterium]
IGIFRQNAPPGTTPLVDRTYINGALSGEVIFTTDLDTGTYYAALFIDDSYSRVSNKGSFSVESGSLQVKENVEAPVRIYPNPSSGIIKIYFPNIPEGDANLKIISLSGEIVYNRRIPSSNFPGTLDLDLSKLMPGLFFLHIESKNQTKVNTFVLVN